MFPSENGDYTVEVTLLPTMVNPSTQNCPFGYGYDVSIDYTVSFNGTNLPSGMEMDDLQGRLFCDPATRTFQLNNGPGAGTTMTANAYNPGTDCATATPASLGCDMIEVTIAYSGGGDGDDVERQTLLCNVTLDLDLISFDASRTEEGARIEWETASEENNSHFAVQRSYDALEWTTFAEVPSQSVNGGVYRVQDQQVIGEVVYYRIVQIELDGSTWNSPLRYLDMSKPRDEIRTWPNPTNSLLHIEGALNDLELLDLMGNVLMTVSGSAASPLDLSSLPEGTYILRDGNRVARVVKSALP
ncbi:MAG: T9SS type A sorting domain-containing protein [Saprospiraceae bacterium]|nr:T9SS type A sorting domain-containing protein [Saprospiraceae bacterium]